MALMGGGGGGGAAGGGISSILGGGGLGGGAIGNLGGFGGGMQTDNNVPSRPGYQMVPLGAIQHPMGQNPSEKHVSKIMLQQGICFFVFI